MKLKGFGVEIELMAASLNIYCLEHQGSADLFLISLGLATIVVPILNSN